MSLPVEGSGKFMRKASRHIGNADIMVELYGLAGEKVCIIPGQKVVKSIPALGIVDNIYGAVVINGYM